MTGEHKLYLEIGRGLNAEESQLFGKPCFKSRKKAFICFFQNEFVCKLNGEEHKEALSLPGSKLFDPSGKGRPMKTWVQISAENSSYWATFARYAIASLTLNN